MIDDLPPLREIIREHKLTAKKSLGQNFLLDLNLTAHIASLAGPLSDALVIEIGPGPGGLTRGLLSQGARKIIAIERDQRCISALKDVANRYPGRLEIVAADALKFDYFGLSSGETRIIANLPYNIATKLLVEWLRVEAWPPFYQSMTLMFQKEVAERICARPGTKSYGRLAVLSQWRTRPEIVLRLPARAFTPPPKIDSAVVSFKPILPRGVPCTLPALEAISEALFGQRRKMLRGALKQLMKDPLSLLNEVDIDPEQRAEQLDIEDFTRLAAAFEMYRGQD